MLNSLAGEFVDASLGLLPRGGRFIEMGKTDIRDPGEVAEQHAGVAYRAFDLAEAGPERIGEMLRELVGFFEQGALELLPVRVWDVRRAREAFRFMSQARHVGKIVLTLPRALDRGRSVLGHGRHGRVGRSGRAASGRRARGAQSGAGEPSGALRRRAPSSCGRAGGAGCAGEVVACDVADRSQVEGLLEQVCQRSSRWARSCTPRARSMMV